MEYDCAALDSEESVVIRFIRVLCGSFYGKLMSSTIGISANELSKSTEFGFYFERTVCHAGSTSELDAYSTNGCPSVQLTATPSNQLR